MWCFSTAASATANEARPDIALNIFVRRSFVIVVDSINGGQILQGLNSFVETSLHHAVKDAVSPSA